MNAIAACPRPRFLPPIAFAIVMSTGTLACATLLQATALPWLEKVAWALNWLNFAIFACLCPYALCAWLLNRARVAQQCQLPGDVGLFSTSGIALLVMAHQCLLFELGFLPALCFWLAGAIVTFGLNLAIFYKVFVEKHGLEQITPVFFIPMVGLLVLPAGGAAFATDLAQPYGQMLEVICLLGLGGGIMLYAGLFPALLQRHIAYEALPDPLAPTYWIHLAPLGWGGIGAISMAYLIAPQESQETARFFCLLIWGAAAWWTIMAALLTIRALIRKGMSFSLAWWSFIFPLGSFALLTRLVKVSFAGEIAFCVWALMAFIWLMAGIRTILLLIRTLRGG